MRPPLALVFAYSEVGVRCLEVLYAAGVHVPVVVTHDDHPDERRWFASVAELARARDSTVLIAPDARARDLATVARTVAPDLLFSFYYRDVLPGELLEVAPRGAFNMHGSLLPKYRGRAPVNWAIANGETETGASLHRMVERPDAGPLVDQERVEIGPDDTALIVSRRVADAASTVLRRSLPQLIAGSAPAVPLDLARGSYFGRRSPSDGEFDWSWPADRIHNLVRAVAPPWPGAYASLCGSRLDVHCTRRDVAPARHASLGPCMYVEADRLVAECGDRSRLFLDAAQLGGAPFGAAEFVALHGRRPLPIAPAATLQRTDIDAGVPGDGCTP